MDNDKALDIVNKWRLWEGYQSTWNAKSWDNVDMAMCKHWTEGQKKKFWQRGQVPLEIDRISPVLEHKVALSTAGRPGWQVFPVRPGGDESIVRVNRAGLYYVWDNSNANIELADAIWWCLTTGRGILWAHKIPMGDDGFPEIIIESVSFPHEVLFDPNLRRRDYEDAEGVLFSAVMGLTKAIMRHPEHERAIKAEAGNCIDEKTAASENRYARLGQQRTGDVVAEPDKLVRMFEFYDKKIVKFSGYMPTARAQRLEPRVFRQGTEDEETLRLQANGFYEKPLPVKRVRVYRYVSVGNTPLYEEEIPISKYPFCVMTHTHTGTPYPLGEVDRIKGLQKEIDKRRALLQYHAAVSAAMRVVYQTGAIDKKLWAGQMAVPGALLPYNPTREKPEFIVPPTSGAIATLGRLEESAKYDMEYAAGVTPQDFGISQGAPRTAAQSLMFEEAGSRRLNSFVRHSVYPSVEKAGNIVLELMPHVWDYEKFIRVADLDGSITELTLNQRRVIEIGRQSIEIILNDVGRSKCKCEVIAGSTMAQNQYALMDQALNLYDRRIIDRQEAIKYVPFIEDKPGVLERMDENLQLRQALQQTVEVMKGLKRQNDILQNETRRARLTAEIDRGKTAIKGEETETRLKHRAIREKMQSLYDQERQALARPKPTTLKRRQLQGE